MRIVETAKTYQEMNRLRRRAKKLYAIIIYKALTHEDLSVRRSALETAVQNAMDRKLYLCSARSSVTFDLIRAVWRHNAFRHSHGKVNSGWQGWFTWQTEVGLNASARQAVPVLKVVGK